MMHQIEYMDEQGSFTLRNAQRYRNLYFPLVNEGGMISSVTPLLAGDCKSSQDTFLLSPASEESLRSGQDSRNFWVCTEGSGPWSVTGQSALQQAARFEKEGEETVLTAGLLWQRITRKNREENLQASVLSFVPAGQEKIEIMQVTLANLGSAPVEMMPVAAIPLYGRSADNIRDHRHVTSLLHRVELRRHGVDLTPTLTFDERGHQPGQVTYRVWGGDETGAPPQGFLSRARDFVGEGSWDWPEAVLRPAPRTWLHAGQNTQGGEAVAALFFQSVVLLPGERRRYQVILAIDDSPAPYLTPDGVDAAFEKTRKWWQSLSGQAFHTADQRFDAWMRWVAVQPILRRICGCSFLPHHDYGRGGRGWRGQWRRETRPEASQGTVLEHLLVQVVTAFYDVGEHGHMRLRGADWNDGLDRAVQRGESVAFTAAYAYGFELLARMTERLAEKGTDSFVLSGTLAELIAGADTQWGNQAAMQRALLDYCAGADRDWYLFHPQRGGYCLNSDFGEVKLDMGRMFGFAYGHKENGAVFSHMAVMYAYALYARGFVPEGWKVLRQLYRQSDDFVHSEILPGIPEYFDIQGRGMYPYLTGAGSWLLLTLQTEVFGVRGNGGDLLLEPKLVAEQFDARGCAEICCTAAGRKLFVRYGNPDRLEYGTYRPGTVTCGQNQWTGDGGRIVVPIRELPESQGVLELTVTLIAAENGSLHPTCGKGACVLK